MKESFKDIKLNRGSREKLELVNKIIDEYEAMSLKLTLRQLYYQLVARDCIENLKKEYDKLCKLVSNARYAGLIDWEAIEDRLRLPKLPYWAENVGDAIQDTVYGYRLNRMKGQANYIEVWVEKDALSSVLGRITSKYHIRLLVNRGYGSTTAMYDAYKRFRDKSQILNILYVGDHDPSGLDMVRDIRDRLETFGVIVSVEHVALTTKQVKEYNPPPNYAKITDPRAAWYISKFGRKSWEVDALPPEVLSKLLTEAVESLVDLDLYEKILEQEWKDQKRLKQIAKREARKET